MSQARPQHFVGCPHESDIADADQLIDVYGAMFERVAEDDSIDDLAEQQMMINF